MLCVCCGMWRWWGKGLVCMKSFTKYMFSLHSASFPPSLSWLSSCVCLFLCLFHSLCTPIHASVDVWICVLELLLYQNVVLHSCVSGRVSVCVCECLCLQVFEAVTPGGSHYISAGPLQVGTLILTAGSEDIKPTHTLRLGKVFTETNLTMVYALQIVLR